MPIDKCTIRGTVTYLHNGVAGTQQEGCPMKTLGEVLDFIAETALRFKLLGSWIGAPEGFEYKSQAEIVKANTAFSISCGRLGQVLREELGITSFADIQTVSREAALTPRALATVTEFRRWLSSFDILTFELVPVELRTGED